MNESNRHAVWVLGMVGSLTLSQWNTIVGIACGAAGFVAACLSIYSWVEKRRRREKEEMPNVGLAKAESRNEPSKRKHHHRTLMVFLVLVAGLLIAAMAKGEGSAGTQGTHDGTNGDNGAYGTTGLVTAANASSPLRNACAVQVADDVRKLVYDFLSGFSWAGLFAVYLGVKGLRNFTPLGRSGGKIGTLLRLINLEANALKQMSEQTKQSEK